MATTPPATAFKKLRLSIQLTAAPRQNILEHPPMHGSLAVRKFCSPLFLPQQFSIVIAQFPVSPILFPTDHLCAKLKDRPDAPYSYSV